MSGREKWKSTMTDRERFNNQMHHKPVDRCFNMEFGYWKENFEIWSIFKENKITNTQQANEFLAFDKHSGIGGNFWMDPVFEESLVEVKESTKIIINNDGLLAEVPLNNHGTIAHFLKASIVTPDDWKQVKEERFWRESPTRKVDVAALLKDHPNDRDYPLSVYVGSMIGRIRDMLTFEGLAYACFDYPEMVEDMVETACVLVEDFLDQVLPHIQFDFACGWEDICYKNGPIVTLDFFKEVLVPRYKRINKKLKTAGIDLWYADCDGDIRAILPYMMDAGINCIFPLEVNCSGRPGDLIDQYGKDLKIMGGFDKMKLIEGKEAIKEYMEYILPYVEQGGYIPFCDHLCPPDVKEENYLYYLDLKEKMFGM